MKKNKYTNEEQKMINEMYNIMLDRLFITYIAKNFPPIYMKGIKIKAKRLRPGAITKKYEEE